MAGFHNDTMNALNVNFGTVPLSAPEITQAGQLLIGTGSAVKPMIAPAFLTAGAGIAIVNGPGAAITITNTAAGAALNFPVDAFTAPGTNPVVPTGGGAVTVHGTAIAASGFPVRSDSVAANAIQIEVQRSTASGASLAANAGLCSFDNTEFTVDANGFVQLAGGGLAIDSIGVQAFTAPGTNPVVPNGAGLLTINGAAVANVGIPIQSDSIAANTLQIEVQRATSSAGTDATHQGLSSFNSAQFTVDANGWVSEINGLPATKFTVDAFTGPGTNPVVPTAAGVVSVFGASVTAGTNPVRTDSLAANSYRIEVQTSQAIAGTDATKIGLAAFNSAQFTVDANGFVSALTGTAPWLDSAGGALANHTGYFATAAAVYTLPAGAVNGDEVDIVDFIGGGVVLTAQGGDKIRIGNVDSSVNGTATSTQLGDSGRFVFRAVGQVWVSVGGVEGGWILA